MRTTSKSLLGLALDGVYKHLDFHQSLVVSNTTISPLLQKMKRYIFCCTFHIRKTNSTNYVAPCPAVLGLSSLGGTQSKTKSNYPIDSISN